MNLLIDRLLYRHRFLRLVVKAVRAVLVLVLWPLGVALLIMALAKLARIFTGDANYGALDGFQFIDALYGAVVRGIAAGIVGYVLMKLLQWRPGATQPQASTAGDDEPDRSTQPVRGR